MPLMNEIPDSFWSLFRSYNRETYIEALLKISEEYQYNNYFLSREVCIQVLSNFFAQRRISIMQEEQETDADLLEPPATRILNWLVRTQWLKRLEDYGTGMTNIIIPDYSAVFIEAFEKLAGGEEDDTEVYIQNIYAILFSYKNDPRRTERLLNTALVNTKRLNKALQDMLHNMDKFFSSLLEKKFYGDLLKEHLDGYVEEIVKKKYHILKTTDNFYLYKTDIKRWLREIREEVLHGLKNWDGEREEDAEDREGPGARRMTQTLDQLSQIERGFDDIEHRIANMDREHTKYVRATVTRLNYLLNEDDDMRGLVVQLLNLTSQAESMEERITEIGNRMNLSRVDILSEKSLYKRRRGKRAFLENLEPEEEAQDLPREDVLKLNRLQNRYSRRQIEAFISAHMRDGKMVAGPGLVQDEEDYEKLILAYDYAMKKGGRYQVELPQGEGGELVSDKTSGGIEYRYPEMVFTVRKERKRT